jgi:hypothetical protein
MVTASRPGRSGGRKLSRLRGVEREDSPTIGFLASSFGGGRMAIDLSDGNRRLVYWPFFIFGMLSPLASVGERWMPRYMADAFVFFVLFAVAAFAAARLSHPPQSTSIGKILLGSAAGAAVGGGLRYLLS